MKKNILIMGCFLTVLHLSGQTPGSLDGSFGNGGKVYVDLGGQGFGTSIAFQDDQKIVMGGYLLNPNVPTFGLLRFNPDGVLDNSFGNNGVALNNFPGAPYMGKEVLIQQDGKIILVGEDFNSEEIPAQNISITRYDADGTVDVSFGTNGTVIHDLAITYEEVNTAALQADGKILVAGYMQGDLEGAFIARFNPNGSFDPTFNGNGFVHLQDDRLACIRDITVLDNGKILGVGRSDISGQWGDSDGSDILLVRLNADGSADVSFDGDGKVITSLSGNYIEGTSVDVQTDGKIVISGNHYVSSSVAQMMIARYHTNGIIDSSFAVNGMKVIAFGSGYETSSSVVVQPGGDILIGGGIDIGSFTQRFALACFTPWGDLNTQFDTDGKVETVFSNPSSDYISRLLIQPDGKVLAGGSAKENGVSGFALARYHTGNFLGNEGNKEDYNQHSMKLFPNPSSGIINVEFQLTSDSKVTIRITDLTGRILVNQLYNGEASAGHNLQSIHLPASLSSGIYVITLTTKDSFSSQQFIKD